MLTEAVRRKPYTVVLLDEVEKAHPDVLELFFQVFDKGMLEDGEGREIDFKNTVILLTSNVGTDTIMKLCADPDTMPEPEGLAEALRPELLKRLQAGVPRAAWSFRTTRLRDENLKQIIHLQLGRIKPRLQTNHRAQLVYDDALVDAVRRAAPRSRAAPATSTTSSPGRCCPRSRARCSDAWPPTSRSRA